MGLFEPSSLYGVYIKQQEAQSKQDYSIAHEKISQETYFLLRL